MNKPIEDLFALAEEAIAPVIWTEKKSLQKFKESATPERVREVAEELRALEQRAEAAEDALAEEKRINSKLREDRAGLARECNALEAKLAETQIRDIPTDKIRGVD